MIRNRLNFLIDLVTLIIIWAMLTSGLLIKYTLPPGTGRSLAVGGMNRHEWGSIHFYLAMALCGLLVLHVFMHWQWVCATVQRLFSASEPNGHLRSRVWRMVWGAAFLVFLAAGTTATLWQANRMVAADQNSPGRDVGGRGQGRGLRTRAGATSEDHIKTSGIHGRQENDARPDNRTFGR